MSGSDEEDADMHALEGPRVAYGEIDLAATRRGVQAALQSGNVQEAAGAEHMELTLESAATRERQEALLKEFQMRRRARSLAVPTDDKAVRAALRARGEPITLFGEREMERRERLRTLLAALDAADGGELPAPADAEMLTEAPPMAELFYTEGSEALLAARMQIASQSLRAAATRLAAARSRAEAGMPPLACAAGEHAAVCVAALSNECSQIGDERPLSALALSPDGARLLTGGWSGCVSMWGSLRGNCDRTLHVRAHEERVTGVAWHPAVGAQEDAVAFATAACDKTAKLWSANGTLLRTLVGHADRLGRVAFHPGGAQVATAGFDATWRLWDCETGRELLCQEGHSRAVYCVAFQNDGALALSGGLDGHARVWDMRTGRSVLTLSGHVRAVLACDWSPDGHTAATGAGDHAARLWDCRAAGRCIAQLPAHAGLLTAVRFEPRAGGALLTSSHDGTVKLWGAPAWGLLRAMRTGEGRIMAADLVANAELVATAAYDRTVRIWAVPVLHQQGGADAAMQEA